MDQQTAELIQAITEWHVNRMDQLQSVMTHPNDEAIKMSSESGEEFEIAGDSEMAKGVRIGAFLARRMIEKLPFTFELQEPAGKNGSTSKHAKLLAAQLDGSEYRREATKDQIAFAKAQGLVIVFGCSDDLMEFRGAIDDEVGAYEGGTALVDAEGLLPDNADNLDTDEERARYYYRKGKAKTIEALWCKEPGYSWTYSTEIPHETFEVVEDGEPYCRGIVFALADVGV